MLQYIKSSFKKNAYYWIFVIITAALCYGFTLTNPSLGVDDEAFDRYIRGSDLLIQGRFFAHYMRYILDTYAFLPFWRDFFALVLMIFGATGIAHAYQLFSNGRFTLPAQTALVCVAIAFPYIASGWVFMGMTVEIGYLYVVTALCLLSMYQVFLGHRTVANSIGMVLLFLLNSVIMEQGTTMLLTCGTAALALYVLYSQRQVSWKRALTQYGVFLFVLAITMVAFKLLGQLIIWLNGLHYTGYIENYILYDMQNLPRSVFNFLVSFPGQLWSRALQDKALLCYLLLCVVLLAAGIRSCVRSKSPLPVFAMAITALAPLGLMLITGNVGLDPRTLINLGLATGLPAGLLLIEANDLHIGRLRFKWVAAVLVMLLVFNLSRSINRIFYADELKYQQDKALTESVMTDLREVDVDMAKPVVFFGLPDGPEYTMGSPATTSIYVWDRVFSKDIELNSDRIFNFIRAHGYQLRAADNIDREQLFTQVSKMPYYPADGYVKDCGSYVLVLLGEPGIAHFELSREDFFAQHHQGTMETIGNLDYIGDTAENFFAGGWAGLASVDSTQTRVSVCLVSDSNQYVLRAQRKTRSDVTAYINNGTNYDGSGFSVYPTDLYSMVVQPGTYRVMLWIHSPEYSELFDTESNVICD